MYLISDFTSYTELEVTLDIKFATELMDFIIKFSQNFYVRAH